MIRAIVIGRKTIVQKLTQSLKGMGLELVDTTEVPELIALLKQETFDLVFVDSLTGQIEEACHYIREFGGIPLVLIADGGNADWKQLRSLGADGFLPEKARKGELAARFRVMLRRFFLPDRLRISSLQPGTLNFSTTLIGDQV